MTPEQAAALMTYASAFDNRNVTAEAATAWADTLAPYVNLHDGRRAVSDHYATTSDWIMPAHINRAVKRYRAARIAEAPYGDVPPELDPAQTQAWLTTYRRALGDGNTVNAAHQAADHAHNITRPPEIEPNPERVTQLIDHVRNQIPTPPTSQEQPDDAA